MAQDSRLVIDAADINDLLALKEIVVRRKARYENTSQRPPMVAITRQHAAEETAKMARLLAGMTIGLAPAAATPAADEGAYVVLNDGETFAPLSNDTRIVFVAESGDGARLEWQEITEAPVRSTVSLAELWAFAVAHGFKKDG